MKIIYKIAISFLVIAAGVILCISISWMNKSEAEKMIISCKDIYKKSMKLENIDLDEDKKKMKIFFEMKTDLIEEVQEDVSKVYKEIIDVCFNNKNQTYEDYSVDAYFEYKGSGIVIFNIDSSLESVRFHSNTVIYIRDIARLFPNISELELFPPYYDDIKEIDEFTQLDYVHFAGGITAEEKKYILSIYPECDVDEQAD